MPYGSYLQHGNRTAALWKFKSFLLPSPTTFYLFILWVKVSDNIAVTEIKQIVFGRLCDLYMAITTKINIVWQAVILLLHWLTLRVKRKINWFWKLVKWQTFKRFKTSFFLFWQEGGTTCHIMRSQKLIANHNHPMIRSIPIRQNSKSPALHSQHKLFRLVYAG